MIRLLQMSLPSSVLAAVIAVAVLAGCGVRGSVSANWRCGGISWRREAALWNPRSRVVASDVSGAARRSKLCAAVRDDDRSQLGDVRSARGDGESSCRRALCGAVGGGALPARSAGGTAVSESQPADGHGASGALHKRRRPL